MEGIIGRKVGMTQVYDDQGRRISVTVLEVGPCPVVQVKTPENDGYSAAQLGYEEQKPSRLSKAEVKHFEKAGVKPCKLTKEFALDEGEQVKPGDAVTVNIFDGVKYVDVTGVTKGRGFAGVVRRYRMRGGPMTHGGHSKRRIGGIGARDLPGWVEKGKRMPGHMGAVNRKTRNLAVVQVRGDENLLLVAGSVPGTNGGVVIIRKALKK
ncbi:MAG: 50S ribosomal protein L3 [Verrucomicrobiota bacterium]|jgi:large subunit ribosomal protein L3|nr:50S ribosomal protein L3 [Verrucomicrobiota bacterium]